MNVPTTTLDNSLSEDTNFAVHIKNLKFIYPTALLPVLDIAELKVAARERVFLYGPSGCGKTTLLGIMSGILEAHNGNVTVLGKDMVSLSGSERDDLRGERLGYIFQLFNLIPYLSVWENIVLPCQLNTKRRAALKGMPLKEAARDIALSLGIEKLFYSPVTTLSVGQQQRVAAARALVGHPELIIADEPTSALDTELRNAFLDLLFTQCVKRGTALIFVSHDRSLMPLFERHISLPEINRAGRA